VPPAAQGGALAARGAGRGATCALAEECAEDIVHVVRVDAALRVEAPTAPEAPPGRARALVVPEAVVVRSLIPTTARVRRHGRGPGWSWRGSVRRGAHAAASGGGGARTLWSSFRTSAAWLISLNIFSACCALSGFLSGCHCSAFFLYLPPPSA